MIHIFVENSSRLVTRFFDNIVAHRNKILYTQTFSKYLPPLPCIVVGKTDDICSIGP